MSFAFVVCMCNQLIDLLTASQESHEKTDAGKVIICIQLRVSFVVCSANLGVSVNPLHGNAKDGELQCQDDNKYNDNVRFMSH